MYEVIFYKDTKGNEPIKEYLYELKRQSLTSKRDRIVMEKILAYLKAMQDYGTCAGYPVMKHLEGDLWELRPLSNRIIFFYWKDDIFVLLHHFIKKTRKTPVREIEQARRNLKDFLERSR
jgi:phage-related protein